MKEAYKDKDFGNCTNFRWHGNLKKERLSSELALKPDRPVNVVNGRNVYPVKISE